MFQAKRRNYLTIRYFITGSAPGPSLGEAPPPPRPGSVGGSSPVRQLRRQPGGDAPSGAVKVEGLMDSSEAPTKM